MFVNTATLGLTVALNTVCHCSTALIGSGNAIKLPYIKNAPLCSYDREPFVTSLNLDSTKYKRAPQHYNARM